MLLNILEVLTIGFPFCAFKIISGQYLNQPWLIFLGLIDLVLNSINLISLFFYRRRVIDACLFSWVVRWIIKPNTQKKQSWQYFGNSVDVLISFTLVAWMVGKGNIPHLATAALSIWNCAVVLNVMGAGLSQISSSIKNL